MGLVLSERPVDWKCIVYRGEVLMSSGE